MGRLNPDHLRRGARIALDTVPLVHFLEGHPVHAPVLLQLFHGIEEGRYTAAMSSLVLTELLVPAWRAGDGSEARRLKRVLQNFANLDILDLTPEIATEAARLRSRFGLRTPDAIHAATALAAGARHLVTNDRDFLRIEPGVEVLLLE